MPLDLNKLTRLSADRDETKVTLSRVEEEYERVSKKLAMYRERLSTIEVLITNEAGTDVVFDTLVAPTDDLIEEFAVPKLGSQ